MLPRGSYKLLYVAPERLESSAFPQLCHSGRAFDDHSGRGALHQPVGAGFPPPATSRSLPLWTVCPGGRSSRPLRPQRPGRCRRIYAARCGCRTPKVLVTGFDRPNLYFQVEATRRKDDFVLQYLRDHPGESGIIYCATRKNVDKLQELLVEAGCRRQIPRRADRRGPPHQPRTILSTTRRRSSWPQTPLAWVMTNQCAVCLALQHALQHGKLLSGGRPRPKA